MNIKRFLGEIFFTAMLLCSEGAAGQTLTKVTSSNYNSLGVVSGAVGAWVLDCTMIEENRLASYSITDSEDLYTHVQTGDTNRVYPKLLIAGADADYANTTWVEYTTSTSSYYIGNYGEYGYTSGWRLPTQRELMLMWILSQKESGLAFATGNYWSATKHTTYSGYIWYTIFNDSTKNGYTLYIFDYFSYYARPVRELSY